MNVNEKLSMVQTKLKAPKGQYNSFGGYNYRSLEDIMEAVKPILAEVNAFIIVSDEIVCIGNGLSPIACTTIESAKGKEITKTKLCGGDRYYVKATAIFSDGDNEIKVSGFAREPLDKKGMDESQITGAASSYARKYALNGLLAIDDTKDADATNKHGKQNGKSTEPAKYKKPDKKKVSKVERAKLVEQAWFNFQTVHKDEMPDGQIFKEEFFKEEVTEQYKKLTAHQKKTFDWNQENVNKLAEKVLPKNCLTDIGVAPDA